MGRDEFPRNTTQLLSQLNKWRSTGQRRQQQQAQRPANVLVQDEDGLNFAQEAEEDASAGVQMFIGSGNGYEEDVVQFGGASAGTGSRNRRG
jgi:hypothetical protein